MCVGHDYFWILNEANRAWVAQSLIRRGFALGFVNCKKKCSLDPQPQVIKLASMVGGTPASSTTKRGRHDIAESGIKDNKSIKYK
jgi:hypothetical protein